MKKEKWFILLEFNDRQNCSHFNEFDEKTMTFRYVPNTNNWEPICIFNYNNSKECKIVREAEKLAMKVKENKLEKFKSYIDANIMSFSKDSVYWDNIAMRKIRKG